MAEETYRVERRKITPEAISGSESPPDVYIEEKQSTVTPDAKTKVVGKMPTQMRDALERMHRGEEEKSESETPSPRPNLRVTGSQELESILQVLKDTTQSYEEVLLPSMGHFYDGQDGPENGKLHLRPMTGAEEEILTQARLVRNGQAFPMILRQCIQERIDTNRLLSADLRFLMIFLRGISYGPDYDVEITCPECDRNFAEVINLNFDVTQCPDDYRPPLQGKLPQTGLSVSYQLSRGIHEMQITEHRERRGRVQGNQSTDDTLIFRLSLLVEQIETLSKKSEIQIVLHKLPAMDLTYLRNVTGEPPFGVEDRVSVMCKYCFHEFEVDLPFTNFFFPRRRRTSNSASD